MRKQYSTEFKATVLSEIYISQRPRLKVAEEYGVPIKTLEKWITACNKDRVNYSTDELSDKELIKKLEKQVSKLRIENEILKKTIALLGKKE